MYHRTPQNTRLLVIDMNQIIYLYVKQIVHLAIKAGFIGLPISFKHDLELYSGIFLCSNLEEYNSTNLLVFTQFFVFSSIEKAPMIIRIAR